MQWNDHYEKRNDKMSSMRGFQESDLIISTKCIFLDQFVKQTVSNKDSLQSIYKLKAGEVWNAAQQSRSALWCAVSSFWRTETCAEP